MKTKKKDKSLAEASEATVAKKRSRFGFLDIAIILLIIITILGTYFRFNLVDTITQTAISKNYAVSFSVKNIRYTTPNYINVNDKIYLASSGEQLGTIIEESDEMSNIALSVTPSSEVFIENGKYIEVYYPNGESRVDANGRFLCQGAYTDDRGLLINGATHITAGQSIEVRTELVTLTINITNIELYE